MQSKTIGIMIVVLVVIVGGYFLLRGGYRTPTPTPMPTSTEAPSTTQAPVSEVREISVTATEFSFNPTSITVKAGERIKLIFKNNGRAPHNLTIERLNIGAKTIGGGQTDIIEFIAPSSGTYTFFCSVPGHRASGMEGDLEVK